MIKFSVCPHDTLKGIERWHRLAKELESILGEEVVFKPLFNFEMEYDFIEREGIELYYSSPRSLKRLLDRGYEPIAKMKGQKDRYFLIKRGNIPAQGEIVVALPFLDVAGYALLGLDIERVKLIFTKDFYEAFLFLREGKAHLAIMYNETWEDIEEGEKEGFTIIENYPFESSHIFVAHPALKNRIENALLSIENIEKVKKEDIEIALNLTTEFERFLKLWSLSNIAKALEETPQIGVLIYDDRVVYANESTLNMIGYKREELIGKETTKLVESLIASSHREMIKETLSKVLLKDKPPPFFSEVPFLRRDGSTLWTLTFADNILYQGGYRRIALFIDITKKKRVERLYSLLKKVNQIIKKSLLEEELFDQICKALVEEMGLRFVWVGVPDEASETIKPIYRYGYEEGYLEGLKIQTREDLPEGIIPAGISYRENKIVINPDTLTSNIAEPLKSRMLQRKYLSSTSIPLRKGNEVAYILNLYAEEPLFFEEETRDVMEEIKSDLEFALNRIEETRQSMIALRAIENSSWIMITDEEGKIVYVNDAVLRISGYSRKELLGKSPRIFKSGHHPPVFYIKLWETITSGKTFHGRFINRGKNGEIFHLEQTIHPLKLPDGSLRFISVGLDVTKEVILSSELERLHLYDPLTDLLNARGFYRKAEETLKEDKIFLFGILDLYNFSSINGIYGMETGNALLKAVGERLKEKLKDKGVISRISADGFGILYGPLKEEDEAIAFLEKVRETFKEPFTVEDKRIPLSINMGIALYPKDGRSFKELFERASLSLREAQERGEGEVRFFEITLERKMEDHLLATSLVERAINNGLFIFHYQPYFKAKDLSLAGFEALVRIKDTDGTLYPPKSFIDYLEKSRHLKRFEEWAITEISRKAEEWNIPISINISAKTLEDEDFWNRFAKICLKSPLNIEITERVFIESSDKIIKIHEKLKECKNIRFALDDFGTGYSSLYQIATLPIDLLKIDASFVRELTRDPKKRIIVKNIINLSKDLGIETLAEGVESEKELKALQDLDCTYLQGFLLSRPLPEEEAKLLLKNKGKGT